MKYFISWLILIIIMPLSAQAIKTKAEYPKSKTEQEIESMGSILDNNGPLWQRGKSKSNDSNVKFGNVNKYLYKAALDVLKMAPINAADSYAGVVSTDWYVEHENATIRYRVNVYVKDGPISPESIEVKAFYCKKNRDDWHPYDKSEDKAVLLEEEILRVARNLYQREKK